MRPQIDISHTIHGRIQDLKDDTGMGIDEIYEEALIRGLNDIESHLIKMGDEATQNIRSRQQLEERISQ